MNVRTERMGYAERVRRAAVLVACVALLVPGPAAADWVAAGPAAADWAVVDWAAAGPARGGQPVAREGYHWPLSGRPQVVRPFDPPLRRWLPGHRGVDLAAAPATAVRAAGPGVVFFAGPVAGVGVVSIDHAGGLRTTYQPVVPMVAAGDAVAGGDPIGVLAAGHPGCPAEACLHWGLRRGEMYLDPLALLGLGRVRLLPRPRMP